MGPAATVELLLRLQGGAPKKKDKGKKGKDKGDKGSKAPLSEVRRLPDATPRAHEPAGAGPATTWLLLLLLPLCQRERRWPQLWHEPRRHVRARATHSRRILEPHLEATACSSKQRPAPRRNGMLLEATGCSLKQRELRDGTMQLLVAAVVDAAARRGY